MDWIWKSEGALKVLKEKGYDGKELIFGISSRRRIQKASWNWIRSKHLCVWVASESHLRLAVGDNDYC